MKTLQKYAKMAFLLLSVATIVPTYANSEDDYKALKERIIQKSKRPEMLKKVFHAGETAFTIVGTIAVVSYVPMCIFTIYRGLKYNEWPK